MTTATILAIAILMDAIFGEPNWLWSRIPHPAILIGRIVGWIDRAANKGSARKLKGLFTFSALCLGAILLGILISGFPGGWCLEILLTAILLAQKSLATHVRAVADALRLSVGDGRVAVAQIVGRDTRSMDQSAISRGAIESAAENLSDGVIAPAFWFLIAGLPGLLLYKVTNTADSMIGYRTERHREFGWAAARFDDLLNWVPARLTSALITLTHPPLPRWSQVRSDASLHRSPNAGWPEAAMAQVLDISLSGPRSYDGQMQKFPYVNSEGRRNIGPADIDAALCVLWRVWAAIFLVVTLFAVA